MTRAAADPERSLERRIEVARQSGVPLEPLRRWAEERRDQTPGHRRRGRARPRAACPASRSRPTSAPGACTRRPGTLPRTSCLFQPERRLLISGDHLLGRVSLYFDYGWTPDPVAEFLAEPRRGRGARRAPVPTRPRPAVQRRAGAHRGEPRGGRGAHRGDRSRRSTERRADRLRAGPERVRRGARPHDDELGADDHALLPRPTSSGPGGSERVRSPDERSRSAGARPLPRPRGLERGQDRARRRRLVERVEVDARARRGRAGRRTAASRRRRPARRPPPRPRRCGASSCSCSAGGIVAPHMLVKRLICSKFVIGMMPGMIGTSMPLARARSTKRK